jgi:SAM-dependent methyltransferase
MPTLDWLKGEFNYGYDSGDVLTPLQDPVRDAEERLIGGSYARVVEKAVAPNLRPDSRVMELGPGRGSWSRAILELLPHGQLHVFDFQDAAQWLEPGRYEGRLTCHRVADNSFREAPASFFDFFWSFGVLCHCNVSLIAEILANSLSRMKPGGLAAHQFADWEKLDGYGWERGGIPLEFKSLPDDEMWWPRNDGQTMIRLAADAGWEVLDPDLGLLGRDGLILLRRPL